MKFMENTDSHFCVFCQSFHPICRTKEQWEKIGCKQAWYEGLEFHELKETKPMPITPEMAFHIWMKLAEKSVLPLSEDEKHLYELATKILIWSGTTVETVDGKTGLISVDEWTDKQYKEFGRNPTGE